MTLRESFETEVNRILSSTRDRAGETAVKSLKVKFSLKQKSKKVQNFHFFFSSSHIIISNK